MMTQIAYDLPQRNRLLLITIVDAETVLIRPAALDADGETAIMRPGDLASGLTVHERHRLLSDTGSVRPFEVVRFLDTHWFGRTPRGAEAAS